MQKKVMVILVLGVLFISACSHIAKVVQEVPTTVAEVQKQCTDNDGDGYGEGKDCKGIDCNDNDFKINPGMKEIPEDKIDNDCRNGDGFKPKLVDTDHDGLNDNEEAKFGLNPKNPDTDGDGLFDFEEIDQYKTDPLNFDSDDDSWFDGCERTSRTDPTDALSFPKDDTDHDGLDDSWEIRAFSNSRGTNKAGLAYGPSEDRDRANTNGRGRGFGDELTNMEEYCYGLNPMSSDTDKDGVEDNKELFAYYTNPLVADSDGDGFNDGKEIYIDGTNPLDAKSHFVYTETRNLGRRGGVRSDADGSYRVVGTYLGQSINTENTPQ